MKKAIHIFIHIILILMLITVGNSLKSGGILSIPKQAC